jgi:hypothetical protein
MVIEVMSRLGRHMGVEALGGDAVAVLLDTRLLTPFGSLTEGFMRLRVHCHNGCILSWVARPIVRSSQNLMLRSHTYEAKVTGSEGLRWMSSIATVL